LDDPYAAVRYVAARSLRSLPAHKNFAYDYLASPPERARARERLLETWKTGQGRAPQRVAMRDDEFARLLSQRNNRSLDLLE
jgi:hypothetical protein